MAKRKYPSELNTRQIRVNVGDWLLLKELSLRLGITIAETFHKIFTGQDYKAREIKATVQAGQMSIFTAIPVTPTIAVNGSQAAAFASKPKGVRYE